MAPLVLAQCTSPPAASGDQTLIENATVVDGTGAPAQVADVRIAGDQIVEVGDLDAISGETVVDATGLTLAPGFIDTHSHHDRGLFTEPDALAVVSQGITTIVVGQDGGSPHPLADFFARLDAEPAAVNVASYSGHNTLRNVSMADPLRAATADEIDAMAALLTADLEAGALGLSTGLEYDPGLYSTTAEVIELAQLTAEHGGRYISHMRSEDQRLFEAIDETIEIGRAAGLPVQISHMKLAMKGLWGRTPEALAKLDAARAEGIEITADVYPYEYWQSTMTVIFPERNFEDRSAFEFALDQVVPAEGLLIARYAPEQSYEGQTLAQIAEARDEDPVDTYMHLVRESQALMAETGLGTESVIATSMHPVDVAELMRWPHANVSSDGALRGGHPRGFGSFPRVLGRTVRDLGLMSLEEAVHKMTGLSATHMGMEGRGTVAPGMAADLVLFDAERIIDHATPEEPHRVSEGVERVWVNGRVVYEADGPTGARPGQVLRRTGAAP